MGHNLTSGLSPREGSPSMRRLACLGRSSGNSERSLKSGSDGMVHGVQRVVPRKVRERQFGASRERLSFSVSFDFGFGSLHRTGAHGNGGTSLFFNKQSRLVPYPRLKAAVPSMGYVSHLAMVQTACH